MTLGTPSLSLEELADRTEGTILCGQPDSLHTGISALGTAQKGDISFLGNPKYIQDFLKTKASAVLVPHGHDFPPKGPALIAVENPTLAFSAVISYFSAEEEPFSPGIHQSIHLPVTAKIYPEATAIHSGVFIGEHVTIGPGTIVSANAVIAHHTTIGKNCYIGPNVSIREHSAIGDRVILHAGCVIGADGYGYQLSEGRHVKIPQVGSVEIGDDVEIGANTTIDRARFGKTKVGEGTKIDNLVQIGHNCVIGKHCLIISQSALAGSCVIEDYVTIAAQVGVAGHITIGAGATLTARTGVTTTLPGQMIYSGKPALPYRKDTKIQAHVRRLPKILERLKALERKVSK